MVPCPPVEKSGAMLGPQLPWRDGPPWIYPQRTLAALQKKKIRIIKTQIAVVSDFFPSIVIKIPLLPIKQRLRGDCLPRSVFTNAMITSQVAGRVQHSARQQDPNSTPSAHAASAFWHRAQRLILGAAFLSKAVQHHRALIGHDSPALHHPVMTKCHLPE